MENCYRNTDVALVGRRLRDNDNIGIAYLKGALFESGFRVRAHYLEKERQIYQIAADIVESKPKIVGISLPDGGSAVSMLCVGEMLVKMGFGGHITCGGQFATLARKWLLDRYRWLDSVVRFDGEAPLVELARAITAEESIDQVAGLTTRKGDGLPAPVLSDLPMAVRPLREELPDILGHRAAHILATRGCVGRCSYCSPAALQSLQKREGRGGGLSLAELNRRGVGGVRRRDLEDVCDEMATLWHDDGVRYFYFVDEHLLPYSENQALDYLSAWKDGLRKRKVGVLGIGCMLRADRLTPSMVRSFADLGLVRAFLGLELAGAREASRFGRNAPTKEDVELLNTLALLNVATVSNLMLVHPYSTRASIAQGIEFLARIRNGVFETTQMQIYHGTRLHRQIEAEGRLLGNPFRYDYAMEDVTARRFSEIFLRLRSEAFWNYSVAYRTHDVYLAMALEHRLNPGLISESLKRRLEDTRKRVNQLYVAAYRQGLMMATQGNGYGDCTPLIRSMGKQSRALERALDEIENGIFASLRRPGRIFAPVRAAAAGIMSFVMLGGLLEGCHKSVGLGTEDAGADVDSDVDTDVDTDNETDGPCAGEREAEQRRNILDTLSEEVSCFSGEVYLPPQGDEIEAHSSSMIDYSFIVQPCEGDSPGAVAQDLKGKAQAALEGVDTSCIPRPVSIPVSGGVEAEMTAMRDALVTTCETYFEEDYFFANGYVITVDEEGVVVGVRYTEEDTPHSAEIGACIEAALEGLVFPCFAGMEICPMHVLAE